MGMRATQITNKPAVSVCLHEHFQYVYVSTVMSLATAQRSEEIGHVNEYPTMHYFGNPKHTQLMIAYMILTEYFLEILVKHC